ncbi:unnamed protein product [Owenia fusiformis]|nr:unnamed protein product [Owenia fusiformis]
MDEGKGRSLDLAELVCNVEKLKILARPFWLSARYVQFVYSCQNLKHTFSVWAVCNLLCLIFSRGFVAIFAIMLFGVLCGLGALHHHNNLLKKIIPDVSGYQANRRQIQNNGHPSDVVSEFRTILFEIDRCISLATNIFVQFYSLIKWQNPRDSIRFYMICCGVVAGLYILPLKLTVLVSINAIFLHRSSKDILNILHMKHSALEGVSEPSSGDQQRNSSPIECSSSSTNSVNPVNNISTQSAVDEELRLKVEAEMLRTRNSSKPKSKVDIPKIQLQSSDRASYSVLGEGSEDEESPVQFLQLRQDLDTFSPDSRGSNEAEPKLGVVSKILDLRRRRQEHAASLPSSCSSCQVAFSAILKRRHICSHCGNHFCSRCCSHKVPRAVFGATAPAAQTETVQVCYVCNNLLKER